MDGDTVTKIYLISDDSDLDRYIAGMWYGMSGGLVEELPFK